MKQQTSKHYIQVDRKTDKQTVKLCKLADLSKAMLND